MVAAVLLVIGTLWPAPSQDAGDGRGPDRLTRLAQTEQLLVFEDYSVDPGGWPAGRVDDRDTALGAVLRAEAGEPLTRDFALPAGTAQTTMVFELITDPDGPELAPTVSDTTAHIVREPLAQGHDRVWIALEAPTETVTLTLTAQGPGLWAIDNLYVIATPDTQD